MRDLKNVSRRYALSFATASLAICIGFVMQTSEAAILVIDEDAERYNSTEHVPTPNGFVGPQLSGGRVIPNLPSDHGHGAALVQEPVLIAVADDIPVGLLPAEETSPRLGCAPVLSAETAAGALIDVRLSATCHANNTVLLEHEGLVFHMKMPPEGMLRVQVPALSEAAVVKASFADGDTAQASTVVDSLAFYDRVVISWRGQSGAELHAREFDAQYGEAGHVWRGQPRDVGALVGGTGGFLITLGDSELSIAAQAEVYTFPTGISQRVGNVEVSVETEVTKTNCDRALSVQSNALRQGQLKDQHEVTMQMPDCSAIGEFLVLKNLVEDLTIAQN